MCCRSAMWGALLLGFNEASNVLSPLLEHGSREQGANTKVEQGARSRVWAADRRRCAA